MNTNFQDVQAFHNRFGLDAQRPPHPHYLPGALTQFRLGFMIEELAEYAQASGATIMAAALQNLAQIARKCTIDETQRDLPGMADALVDLSVVTLGTADFHGLPWQACWDEVQRANMSKERAASDGSNSKRGSAFDVVKPAGWRAPDMYEILRRACAGEQL